MLTLPKLKMKKILGIPTLDYVLRMLYALTSYSNVNLSSSTYEPQCGEEKGTGSCQRYGFQLGIHVA